MSAKCDVLERKKIIDVSASLKIVWVEKQSGETFSFSGGKGSKLRISNLDTIWSYEIYVSNDVSVWRDPKVPIS